LPRGVTLRTVRSVRSTAAYLGTRKSLWVRILPAKAVWSRFAVCQTVSPSGMGKAGMGAGACERCGGCEVDQARRRSPLGVALKPAASRRAPMGEVRAVTPFTRSTVTVPREPRAGGRGESFRRRAQAGVVGRLGGQDRGPDQQGLAAALHVER
jgi:hypothetical protein